MWAKPASRVRIPPTPPSTRSRASQDVSPGTLKARFPQWRRAFLFPGVHWCSLTARSSWGQFGGYGPAVLGGFPLGADGALHGPHRCVMATLVGCSCPGVPKSSWGLGKSSPLIGLTGRGEAVTERFTDVWGSRSDSLTRHRRSLDGLATGEEFHRPGPPGPWAS